MAMHGDRESADIRRPVSIALLTVMIAQSALGLLFRERYRDVDWIRVTWLGNDAFTLIVAAPLLLIATNRAVRSVRAELLRLGLFGYGVYNYAFYMLGAQLSIFFPLHVLAFVLSVVGVIVSTNAGVCDRVSQSFKVTTRVRLIGGTLLLVGGGLATVWLGIWAAYVFAGRPTPATVDVFQLVATLDLALMVPALVLGGLLLWRRNRWGYIIAPIAAIQGVMYLVVLTFNALLVYVHGLSASWSEALLWGSLATVMAIAARTMSRSIHSTASPRSCTTSSPPHRP